VTYLDSDSWSPENVLFGENGIAALTFCDVPIERAIDELLIADFEGDTYGEWKVTGEAFGPGPARGTLPGQMQVDGFRGKGLVNSFFGGDDSTGMMESPEFTIQRRYIAFLIGGGKNPEKLSVQLVIDGQVVRTATGPNEQAGGSEALVQDSWDVAELMNQKGRIRIIDDAKGGWGHINVDHIVQTDRKPPGMLTNIRRDFVATNRYLNIPIKNGAPKRVVTLLVDGKQIVRNDIELAPGDPDWWASMDISAWKGKAFKLNVDKFPEDASGLRSIDQSDMIRDSESLYREPLRAQFHFSPKRGWNNDPNGMVFYNGEYHLFFQHNPYGWGWGNMHWGHAVSRDMVHWEELGDKLLPDDQGPMFSGSAVVDWNNTSGFGSKGKPPLVLIYTAAGNPTVQSIAYSMDGRTFTKYSGNPVIEQITGGNRDPKVMWHEPTQKWVMVLYVEKPAGQHTIHFFTSPNLRDWSLASMTDGDRTGERFLFECPDFFELPVDNVASNKRWVLLGADSQYAIGSFDGTRFHPEQVRLPGHRGRGFYAPQTFSDIPAKDGRRIQIGWFQTETRGMPFNQSMTVPLELKLTDTPQGARLSFHPVRELESLRSKSHVFEALTIQPGDPNPLADIQAELLELRAEFEPVDATEVIFNIRGVEIVYDVAHHELIINGHRASAPLRNGKQRLIVYCDRVGLEVFASDGLTYVPMPIVLDAAQLGITATAKGGTVNFDSLHVHELQSAWK
jgi:sucrose-6-phosphate hydrolase SacC (GH32 family)